MIIQSVNSCLLLATSNNLYKIDLENEEITKRIIENTAGVKSNILCFIAQENLIGVCTSDKQLLIYDYHLNLQNKGFVNRAPSQLCITKNKEIIVADKTGDVYVYQLEELKPKLILGHLSMILDIKLSSCGNYILTADRDEKIRVSHFPNAYNIESFCLGHSEFVTSIKLFDTNLILSGSGDGTVRLWEFVAGKEVLCINCNDAVSNDIRSKFSKEMITFNIETNVLPVVSVEFQPISNNAFHIFVLLYNLDNLLVFEIENANQVYKSVFFGTIQISDQILAYHTFQNRVYVISTKDVFCYRYESSSKSYLNVDNGKHLNDLVKSILCDNQVCSNEAVPMLFKKCFDNIQDYHERKKMRLESSK